MCMNRYNHRSTISGHTHFWKLLQSIDTHFWIVAMASKARKISERSLENLKLGAKARDQDKIRHNFTIKPETIEWLKKGGNASGRIDELVAAAKSGELKPKDTHDRKAENLAESEGTHDRKAENLSVFKHAYKQIIEALKAEVEQLQQQNAVLSEENASLLEQLEQPQQSLDLEGKRDIFLASLRLGKQAPEYKRNKKVIDSFIAFDLSE